MLSGRNRCKLEYLCMCSLKAAGSRLGGHLPLASYLDWFHGYPQHKMVVGGWAMFYCVPRDTDLRLSRIRPHKTSLKVHRAGLRMERLLLQGVRVAAGNGQPLRNINKYRQQ